MAIKPILQFRNQDSTKDLNTTQARIIDRAIFDGGVLTPSGVSLQVTISPFVATGYDGIVAVSDSTETRSIPAPAVAGPSRISYLILHLEYRSLTTPIYNLQVVPETTWLTSVSRNFFVTFAKFTVPFGATSLTDPGVAIDYSVGDWADKLGKTGWRQPVATAAALPTTQNRDGDVRIAFDTRLAYAWNSSLASWSPIGGAVNLAEVSARDAESRHQFHRVTSGSGLLNEIPQNFNPVGPGASVAGDGVHDSSIPIQFPFVPLDSVANTGLVPGCHYLVNGHFVKTHATNIAFAAAPGVGERFDLVILEVWREPIVVPSTETYDDQGGVARSFTVLRTALERMTEQGSTLALSYDLSEMEVYDSTSFVVTRYQYRVVQNVNVSVLTDTETVAASINNFDGNPFSVGTNTDQKLWQATSATSVDGRSWALPLVVVRRSSTELAGPPFIQTFRSNGQRYVFDVAPRAELGMGLFELEEAVRLNHSQTADILGGQRPAGFLSGTATEIGINSNELVFPSSHLFVKGRTLTVSGAVSLPAPPATGGRTDVVVLEIFQTIYNPTGDSGRAATEFSARDRMGPHAVSWTGKLRVISLPLNALQTTPEAAMTATGVYLSVSEEPYLWSRSSDPLLGEDPVFSVLAVPMALVQRRNTGVYGLGPTDQNGADRSAFLGLPNQAATLPFRSEVLDCRAVSVLDGDDLQHILDESFDQLIAGTLRTNMALHPIASSVAGTKLLHIDQIAPGALAGTNLIPSPPNGMQTVWAESDEAELFTWNFLNMDVNQSDATGVFTWDAATNTLSIALPPGFTFSIDGQNPANPYGPQTYIAYSIDGNVAGDRRPYPMQHTYFTGVAPLGWFIQGDPVTPQPMRQTEVVLTLDPAVGYTEAASVVLIGVWAVKRNHEAGRSSAFNSYQQNRGLFAIPDTVHRIEYSLTGAAPFKRAWVGVPLNVITVPVVGDALVIDRATLFASGSISAALASAAGNLSTYAVANVTLSSTSSLDKLRYIQFTDDGAAFPAFERTRIEFTPGSVPPGTTATVTLVCAGNLVDSWFEVDPGTKQVRGPYSIGQNLFSVTASATHLTFPAGSGSVRVCGWGDCGLSVLGAVGTGTQRTAGGLTGITLAGLGIDFSYYASGTGNAAYEIWFNSADRNSARNISSGQTIGLQRAVDASGIGPFMDIGAHSSMYSLRYEYTAGVFGNHTSIMLAPVRTPLPTGALARVYYEYTPYQGLTTGLETKINGTVEGISDQIVFTNGLNNPWIDYRILSTSLRRSSQSDSPPGTYGISAIGSDIGLLYSKGRVRDRNALQLLDGPSYYGGYFVADNLAQPYRQADRPPLAISQRLPFPTKAANGASVGSRYSPENFLSHSVLLDDPAVRPLHPNSGYARSEASPWLLEFSGVSPDEKVWRSQGVSKILYFPLPLNIGETLVGLTIEVESAGPSGTVFGTFYSKNRSTGAFTLGPETFVAPVVGPAATRRLHEVSFIPGVLSSSPSTELVLALASSASDLRVGQITLSVVPNTITSSSSTTLRRYPYDDVRPGVGTTLRKGMKIEIPLSWTTEFSAYESALIQNGRQDYPGVSPSRGRALVGSVLGSTSYGGGGLLGYVPGGDPTSTNVALAGGSAAPGFAGRATAPRLNPKSRAVMTGAVAPDTSVGSALAYVVHNAEHQIYMGVSTGYSNITNGTATVRVGQAVDAFVPVGRPVFRRST